MGATPPPDSTPWGRPIPSGLLAFAAVLGALHTPVFRGASVFSRDVALWLYPARVVVHEALRRGHLPRWNALVGLGYSVPSNPLHGVFYPLGWPAFVGDPLVLGNLVALGHLFLGGVGCARLARRLGASGAASWVAALGWSLSGFTQSSWALGVLLLASAWLPWWALAGWDLGALARPAPRPPWTGPVLRGAAVAGLSLLVGEPFYALFGAGLGAGLYALRVVVDRGAWRDALRGLPGALGALGLGVGLAAPGLVPTLAVVGQTERGAALSRATLEAWSLHPARLVDAVSSGGLALAWASQPRSGLGWMFDGRPFTESLYLGAPLLVLGLAALGLRRDRVSFGMLGVALGALVLALGRHTPVLGWVRAVVVPLRFTRTPEKFYALVVVAVAVLGALGVDAVLASRRRVVWAFGLGVLAYGILWIGAPLGPATAVEILRFGARVGALACLGALAAGATLGHTRAGVWALAAVLVGDYTIHLGRFDRLLPNAAITQVPPVVQALRSQVAPGVAPAPPRLWRSIRLREVELERGAGLFTRSLVPNVNVAFGVASLPGYDPALPRAFMTAARLNRVDLLRVLSVDAALFDRGRVDVSRGLTPLASLGNDLVLVRVEGRLPRVYVTDGVTPVTNLDAALGRLLEADVVAGRTVLLEQGGAGAATTGTMRPCALVRYGDGELEARCESDRPGWAVVVEQYAPGWTARVDGVETPVVRANAVARAVRVGAGTRRVVMRFVPPGQWAGLGLGALALGVWGGLWGWGRRRRGATGG